MKREVHESLVRLAAIDVGSNSFHLLVADVGDDGQIRPVAKDRAMVRLGTSDGGMRFLTDDAIDRGVAALIRMKCLADDEGAPVRAVATSAVRDASNAAVFLERSKREAGVVIEVISGLEEARLIYLGVLHGLPVHDKRVFLCDIGGGSTELLLGYRGKAVEAHSFQMGAVRMTDRYFRASSRDPIRACRNQIRNEIMSLEHWVGGFDLAVGSSGTAKTVTRLALGMKGEPQPDSCNGLRLGAEEIRAACDLLARTAPADRATLPGMEPKRADIALAGAVILDELVTFFGITGLVVSDYALREGILLDSINQDARVSHRVVIDDADL